MRLRREERGNYTSRFVMRHSIANRGAASGGRYSREAVQTVEGRGLIAFRERRIIENRVHKIRNLAFQQEDRLPDMQTLSRIFAEDMRAKKLERLAMKEQFQPAIRVAGDLSPGDFAVVSNANFVGNIFVGKLFFGLSDK